MLSKGQTKSKQTTRNSKSSNHYNMKDKYEIKKIQTTMKNNFQIKHEGNERFCHDEEGSTNGWEKENEIQRHWITTDESSHENTKNLKKEYQENINLNNHQSLKKARSIQDLPKKTNIRKWSCKQRQIEKLMTSHQRQLSEMKQSLSKNQLLRLIKIHNIEAKIMLEYLYIHQ